MKIDWDKAWEACKEPLREIVLAAIPGVLAYLEKLPTHWAVIAYILIRALDKYLHEAGVLDKGLSRF